MAAPTWLTTWSVAAIRAALPFPLSAAAIELGEGPDPKGLWAIGRAVVGGSVFVKLACSEETAWRVWREAQVLEVLGERGLAVPRVVAAGADPAFVATELVRGGEALAYDVVAGATPAGVEAIAEQLAEFLAALHAPETLARARQRVDDVVRPLDAGIELTTAQLRVVLAAMVAPRQRPLVARWCDWIDRQEGGVAAETVLVHGDFHPFNQLWDLTPPRLLAIVDYETSHLAAPEFDFRVLPVFGPGVGVLFATLRRYESLSGRTLNLERIAASHLHHILATAAWRTAAGLPLPPPGRTPAEYVDEAAARLSALGIDA